MKIKLDSSAEKFTLRLIAVKSGFAPSLEETADFVISPQVRGSGGDGGGHGVEGQRGSGKCRGRQTHEFGGVI